MFCFQLRITRGKVLVIGYICASEGSLIELLGVAEDLAEDGRPAINNPLEAEERPDEIEWGSPSPGLLAL